MPLTCSYLPGVSAAVALVEGSKFRGTRRVMWGTGRTRPWSRADLNNSTSPGSFGHHLSLRGALQSCCPHPSSLMGGDSGQPLDPWNPAERVQGPSQVSAMQPPIIGPGSLPQFSAPRAGSLGPGAGPRCGGWRSRGPRRTGCSGRPKSLQRSARSLLPASVGCVRCL